MANYSRDCIKMSNTGQQFKGFITLNISQKSHDSVRKNIKICIKCEHFSKKDKTPVEMHVSLPFATLASKTSKKHLPS